MVGSSQINSDLSSIKSNLVNYDNYINELGASWKGASYDNLVAEASSFSSEFASSITSQMNSFATACDLYEKYKSTKKSLATAKSNYDNAVSADDSESASIYSAEISKLEAELDNLKGQIESALSAVTGVKLEATSTTSTTTITSEAANSDGNTAALDSEGNLANQNIINAAVVHTYGNTAALDSESNLADPNIVNAVEVQTYGNTVALDSAGNLANPNIVHASGVHTDGLAPAMKTRIDKLATRYNELTGNQLVINSGSRTMAEQQALYNKYGSSRAASPNPNAPHIAGMAIDIDSGQAEWLAQNGVLDEFGLSRPLLNWGASGGTNEPWHIEIKEWRERGRDTEYVRSLTE